MTSFIRWLKGFRYAYAGLKYAVATQRNMKFHFVVTFFVLLAAFVFDLALLEWLFLLLAITLVIVTELINTAVEKAVDLAMPNKHPLAKIAKDVAAAAVLVAAVFAIVTGLSIFYTPLAVVVTDGIVQGRNFWSMEMIIIVLLLIIFVVLVAETRFSKKRLLQPSLWMAVSFSMSTWIALFVDQPIVSLLAYAMSVLFLFVLFQWRSRTFPALLFGAMVGTMITWLIFELHLLLM